MDDKNAPSAHKTLWIIIAAFGVIDLGLVAYFVSSGGEPGTGRGASQVPFDVVEDIDATDDTGEDSIATERPLAQTTRTFEDPDVGIRMDLPLGFATSIHDEPDDGIVQIVTYDETSVVPQGGPVPGVKVEIFSSPNPQDQDLLDWVGENGLTADQPESNYQNVRIGKKNGLFEEILTHAEGVQVTYLKHQDLVYIIAVYAERDAYDENLQHIEDLIQSLTFF